MFVSIRTSALDNFGPGKTSSTQTFEVKVEPQLDREQRLDEIDISGQSLETRGTGGRGGTATTYSKETIVSLWPDEIRQIAEEAVKHGVYVLPGRKELLAAYEQLAESERQMAATRRTLAAVLAAQGVRLPAEEAATPTTAAQVADRTSEQLAYANGDD